MDGGALFCSSCREELGTKKSSISALIRSAKHNNGKEKLQAKAESVVSITDHLRAYVNEFHPVGETLPENIQLYRLRVTQVLLQAGIPIEKVEGDFRDLLEENGFRLTANTHLRQCIPIIHSKFRKDLSQELAGKDISVVFDGSTRLGEAFALVTRYVTDDLRIVQRLACLKCVEKSMSGNEISGLILDIVMEDLHVLRRNVIAAMRDGASVNGLALRNIQDVFPNLIDVTCFSHTLDRIGEYFQIPNASEFTNSWVSLFAHSFKARIAFRELTGISPKLLSKTRWWSRWEVIRQIVGLFPDIHGFISNQTDMAPATVRKLLALLDNPQVRALIQAEMAAVIDAGEVVVKATYNLEGDGPLALIAHQVIKGVQSSLSMQQFPRLTGLSTRLYPNNMAAQQQILHYGKQCVRPGIQHFNRKFVGMNDEPAQFHRQMDFFKTAGYFHPATAADVQPTTDVVQARLAAVPALARFADGIGAEWPIYLAALEDLHPSVQPLNWWRRHADQLPTLTKVLKLVMLSHPSSAASERAFSVLNSVFQSRQESALQETIEATLMARMNTEKFCSEALP